MEIRKAPPKAPRGHTPKPGADRTSAMDAVVRAEPDMEALDSLFTHLRPPEKKKFLATMQRDSPTLKKQWDGYIAARHQAFADANPAVAKLDPRAEQSIRASLKSQYPNAIEKLNLGAPVDCDGCGPAYGDRMTDFETSVTFDGKPLNADHVLYHVATMDRPDLYDCLALHFYGNRMVPSVFGDEGPAYGEASHLTIQRLGMYSSPIDGGAHSGHDMYLIPGLGAEFMSTHQMPTPGNLQAFCKSKGVPGFS